jgi:hypothetical protein
VANEWRPWFAAAAPRYPFMINYVVAANVKRFVRLAFVYTFAEIHRCPYMVPLLPINQARDVQSPTRWLSELILPAAAGRSVINLSGQAPDQLLTLVPSAKTSDRRSAAL